MGLDRNTIIGFGLLAVLFFGYFYYTSKGQKELELQKIHIQDSLNKLKPKVDTTLHGTAVSDTSLGTTKSVFAGIKQDSTGKEQLITLENKVVKITFTNKGGQPKTIELKNFKTFDGKPLLLEDGSFNNISFF